MGIEDLLNHHEELALFLEDSSAELISLSLEIAFFRGKSAAYQELMLSNHAYRWDLDPYSTHLKNLVDHFTDKVLDLDS